MHYRLDKYIRAKFGKIPQSIIEKAIRKKDILVNGKKTEAKFNVSDDDSVFIHPNIQRLFQIIQQTTKKHIITPKQLEDFKRWIIFENENILVINKPSGIAVQLGTKTNLALDIIAKEYNANLRLVHRIDKETSGITLFAKNIATARELLILFQNKQISKTYIALLSHPITHQEKVIDAPLIKKKDKVYVDYSNGKQAITKYQLIKNIQHKALVYVTPLTGRTHQIRAHMAYIGNAIVGDKKYGTCPASHLFLHAFQIKFILNNQKINVEAPLPAYFNI